MKRAISLLIDVRLSGVLLIAAVVVGWTAFSNLRSSEGTQQSQGDDYKQKQDKETAAPTDIGAALFKDSTELPAPPEKSRLANELGFFEIVTYDDRRMTIEEKAKDPVKNPAWVPFVSCMKEQGFGAGIANPEETTQQDIDRIVEEVNRSGPFYTPAGNGLRYHPSPASDAFLRCEAHLYRDAG